MHQLSIEKDIMVVSSPTKIEDNTLIRRLEEENSQLKKVVEILNSEINNESEITRKATQLGSTCIQSQQHLPVI